MNSEKVLDTEAYQDKIRRQQDHEEYLKMVAFYGGDDKIPTFSFSDVFKQEFMPEVKRLRKAITEYDECKGRILEVAKAIDSIMDICTSYAKMHTAVRDFLRQKFWELPGVD